MPTDLAALKHQVMLALYKREAAYDAGVAMSNANACELSGFASDPLAFPDELLSDEEDLTGAEQATEQTSHIQKVAFGYAEPKARPNSIAGFATLACGAIASTQDAALVAYRHKITRAAFDAAILSTRAEAKAGAQWGVNGVVCKKFSLKGEQAAPVALEAELLGSGTRATSAAAFAAKKVEGWLTTPKMKVWLESGAARSIDAAPVQGAENISSGVPRDLKDAIESFTFEYDNGMELVYGFGGNGVALYPRYGGGGRKASLSFTLRYRDDTDLDYFRNQTKLAIEFDLTSATLIAAGGAFFFGLSLIVPSFQVKTWGKKGKRGDYFTQDIETTILEDGFNADPFILYVYNAQPTYLAP